MIMNLSVSIFRFNFNCFGFPNFHTNQTIFKATNKFVIT